MPYSRRYMFHGHAAALGGRVTHLGEGKNIRPVKDGFIDLPGSALTVVGGRSTAQLTGGQIAHPVVKTIVRFESATAFSEGVFDDLKAHIAAAVGERDPGTLTATTKVSAEVIGLDVGLEGQVRMQVKKVRGGFTSRSASATGETPVSLDPDTRFESVTFIDEQGKPYTLVVDVEPSVFSDHDTFSKLTAAASEAKFLSRFGHTLFMSTTKIGKLAHTAPVLRRNDSGSLQGTIVKPLKWKGEPFPNAVFLDGTKNTVQIPRFGTIAFGEITIARQARRVTMIRGKLGSPWGGDMAACDFQDNGGWGL